MNEIYRAPWHDYTQRCIYMVTLSKSSLIRNFGTLEGDSGIPPGQIGSSFVSPSETGSAIKEVLRKFYRVEPNIRILQYSIMPDHIHILLFVEKRTEESLGRIIARFKVSVDKAVGFSGVFTKGFNDQILKPSRLLDVLFRYIRENPRRLAVRREHPEYFRRVNDLKIGARTYQAYGNFQLLDCPFKEQVVVHRADTEEIRRLNRERWLYTAANGGVLVSPFVSAAEKAILVEAEGMGGRFILITNESMGERYKPSGRDFELCETGRMLILSANLPGAVTRQTCMVMNALAQAIII